MQEKVENLIPYGIIILKVCDVNYNISYFHFCV